MSFVYFCFLILDGYDFVVVVYFVDVGGFGFEVVFLLENRGVNGLDYVVEYLLRKVCYERSDWDFD